MCSWKFASQPTLEWCSSNRRFILSHLSSGDIIPELRAILGVQQTLFFSVCSMCARNKTYLWPPVGLLRLLPIPHCHWSHIAVDFVTGLPPSEGNSHSKHFSNAVQFVPQPKLLSSRLQTLWYSKFLNSMNSSGYGPQLTSQVWGAFCQATGASAHPYSRNHSLYAFSNRGWSCLYLDVYYWVEKITCSISDSTTGSS